jgi:hypothetical protein
MATQPTSSEIDTLTKQIEARRRELEDDMRALARVRRMLEQQGKNGAVQKHLPAVQKHLPLGNAAYENAGFNESVRITARNTGGKEFTVADVEATLQAHGVKMPNINPRKRISTVLNGMCTDGELVVVREGHGKLPHVYRTA